MAPPSAALPALLALACAATPDAGGPPNAPATVDSGASDSGAADTGGRSGDGCPDGPLLAMEWRDRDLTHALLPGLALRPADGVTHVTEDRPADGVFLELTYGPGPRFEAVTIHLTDPSTGASVGVFEDRLLWDGDRPVAEERWAGPSADALTRQEVATFAYDADGRRVSAELAFDDGRPGSGLAWSWEEGCLVGFDRATRDGAEGWRLTCADGDRAHEVWPDTEPPVRYRWSDDPPADLGPAGVDVWDGAGWDAAAEWTWAADGALVGVAWRDGAEEALLTDDDGTLVAQVRTADSAETERSRWTVGCGAPSGSGR